MKLSVGLRLRSVVCESEAIVVIGSPHEFDLRCGGEPMIEMTKAVPLKPQLEEAQEEGALIGKRYVNANGDFELLVTKSGNGQLSLGPEPLFVKVSKKLPSSD
jgi:hypothetical protein